MADLMSARGERDVAVGHYLASLDAIERHLFLFGGGYSTRADFRSQQADIFGAAIEALLTLGRNDESFQVAERFRARTFSTMLAERDLVFDLELPEELSQARRDLAVQQDNALRKLASLSLREDVHEIAATRKELEAINLNRDDIQRRVRSEFSRFASLQYPEPFSVEQTQRALDQGTLLVSYSVNAESTTVFAIPSSGEMSAVSIEVDELVLRDLTRDLRESLASMVYSSDLDRKEAARRVSAELFELLVSPVSAQIQTSQRILILPDGPLHSLPFAALIRNSEEAQGQYLVEWRPIHIGSSATAFAELKEGRPSTGASDSSKAWITIFGDPSYPEARNLQSVDDRVASLPDDAVLRSLELREGFNFHWASLPYSRREALGIAGLFPSRQVQVHLGALATEEKVKNLDRGVRILHLAAHAVADDNLPLSSFVALTIPEGLREGQGNGLLQAWEILEEVRINADLVVLSGCFTGLGKELRGEGMIGLTRAFQYAGARSLISTLWNVDDQAQAELMIRFYRHLRDGKSKAEALRAAQIQMIREPIWSVDLKGKPMLLENASAPFYWAGVQLYGDWM